MSGDEEEIKTREGQLLAGKYKLIKRLAAGGMGEVYSAENAVIGRPVAIKLLLPEHAQNKTLVARFLTEAQAANIVRHRNVVDVLDIGQAEDGTPFIVQELLDGRDLSRELYEQGGIMSLSATMTVLLPVVEAVGIAHSKGVVHRDIKPDNIFLARVGAEITPKILDFGIAQVKREATDNVRLTSSGVGMGTPAYMSPEQVMSTKDADARSDVWSFGVMLYELLGGKLPFNADTSSGIFVQIATVEPVPLDTLAPHVPADVARIVARCLRKNKDERYPTASELARDMRNVMEGRDVESSSLVVERFDDAKKRAAVAPTLEALPKAQAPEFAPLRLDTPALGTALLSVPPPVTSLSASESSARGENGAALRLDSPGAPVSSMRQPMRSIRREPEQPPGILGAIVLGAIASGAAAAIAFLGPMAPGWPIRAVIADQLQGISPSLLIVAAGLIALVFAAFGAFGVRRAWLLWAHGGKASSVVLATFVTAGLFVAIQVVRAVR